MSSPQSSAVAALRDEFAAVASDRERTGLFAAYLLLFAVTDAYGQVLPLYYEAVGVSVGALGVAKSAGNLVEAVASTPAGVLADTADRAGIAAVAGGVLAVVLVSFPAASSALALGALVVAYAVARLVFGVAATPLLSASFDDGSEGVGWAVRDTAIYVGGALGIAGSGVLVARTADVGVVFPALAPAIFVMVGVLAYTHRPSFDTAGASVRELVADWPPNPLASFRAISRPRVLARFLAVDLLAGLGMGLCFYLVPLYAVHLGIEASAFLVVFGAGHLVAVPFTLAGGVLTDRVGRKALYVGNFAVETVMLAAFALADGAPLFLVGVALFVAQTAFEPAVLAYFFDQFDDDEEGRAWGIDGTVARGIGVVAPAVGAVVYEVEPRLAFAAGAVALFAATLVALGLPE